MPRPVNKAQLLETMQKEHQALDQALAPLTSEQISAVSRATQWSIKDVLAHLTAWEQMCLGWYKAGRRGQTPPLPAKGYNWAQLPALNQHILETHRDSPLDDIRRKYRASYQQMLKTVQALAEEELFTPGRYAWTNKNLLAAYFISATSSHYAWARKEVRKCLKG
jgi:uncharacterized protein (TIGR03083 family)